MSQLSLPFRRGAIAPPKIDQLERYSTGTFHLSVRQVPTATALRKVHQYSIYKNWAKVRALRFPTRLGGKLLSPDDDFEGESKVSSQQKSFLGDLLREVAEERGDTGEVTPGDALSEDSSQEEESEDERKTSSIGKKSFGYQDPWKIYQGLVYNREFKKDLEPPTIQIWYGDMYRIQDQIPAKYFGPEFDGNQKRPIRFSEVADVSAKMYFLRKHTHWGHKIYDLNKKKKGTSLGKFSSFLWTRIRKFLSGDMDPSYSKRKADSFYDNVADRNVKRKSRAERLIEVLKTVDGVFNQRFLAYPEESWSWERYDLFVIQMISILLTDEFLDGELSRKGVEVYTFYEALKKARKTFKMQAHKGRAILNDSHEEIFNAKVISPFIPLYKEYERESGPRKVYLTGLLSQTRGCGTPPQVVILKSKIRFLSTVTLEPVPLLPIEKRIILAAVGKLVNSLPDHLFTGLATKARISVNTSACMEKTRQEGGTFSAIHDIVCAARYGRPIIIRDLETGSKLRDATIHSLTLGEYIFWACLEKVLTMGQEELLSSYLTIVKEPGKARSVTKSSAYLKIVLDLVNKLCSEPLKKGVESSSSGMSKSHHGWNFFKSFFRKDLEDTIFSTESIEEETFAYYSEETRVYRTVFASSTDYTNATDALQHDVAEILGTTWMTKCGIPQLLKGIVVKTCYRPRSIYFSAKGALREIGTPVGNDVNKVRLVKGVLMGDPLTKIVLHLVNACSRITAESLTSLDFLCQITGYQHSCQSVILST
jgi:hypothetical protein